MFHPILIHFPLKWRLLRVIHGYSSFFLSSILNTSRNTFLRIPCKQMATQRKDFYPNYYRLQRLETEFLNRACCHWITLLPILETQSQTCFASSPLSARKPWSTTIPKIPSIQPGLSSAPTIPFAFQPDANTQSAMLSGPPETPRAANNNNKKN